MGIKKASEEEARSYDGILPKIEQVEKELSCDLNQLEWESRVQEFAEAQRRTESTKERKKSVMAELNSELKIAELQESKLAGIVTSRREQRDVIVEVTHDYEAGKVISKRLDTDEIINERLMTTMERQSGLFDELDDDPRVRDADGLKHDGSYEKKTK